VKRGDVLYRPEPEATSDFAFLPLGERVVSDLAPRREILVVEDSGYPVLGRNPGLELASAEVDVRSRFGGGEVFDRCDDTIP